MNLVLIISIVVLSTIFTRLFCALAQNTRLMDKPNARSMHLNPTVRGGGVIFIGLSVLAIPILCYYTQTPFSQQIIFIFSIILLATISFLDDLYQLSAKSRFLVQCLVALLVSIFMRPESLDFILFSIETHYLISIFLFFAVIWAINHFNFMDGLDGFCASQAVFLLASYSLFLSMHPALIYQNFCLILIASLLGFLTLNFPPARIFMGDVGSASLGLITFTIAVIGQQKYQIPIVYWFMLNSLFLFDATITLIRRIINKEEWFAGHKKHAYQRLKQSGIDSYKILLGQTMINVTFLFVLLFFQANKLNFFWGLFLQFAIILPIYYLIEKRFPMFPKLNLEF